MKLINLTGDPIKILVDGKVHSFAHDECFNSDDFKLYKQANGNFLLASNRQIEISAKVGPDCFSKILKIITVLPGTEVNLEQLWIRDAAEVFRSREWAREWVEEHWAEYKNEED